MATAERPRQAKVLFVSALQIQPPRSGGNLRSFTLASALRRHGLDVFVYSLVGRKRDYLRGRRSSIQTWPEGIEEHVDRGVLSAVAWLAGYGLRLPPLWISAHAAAGAASPRELLLPRALRERLRWSDAVVADSPFVSPIFSAPSARGKLRILNTHNVEHHLLRDQSAWRRRLLTPLVRDLEIRAAEACDILVTCCAYDAAYFEANARVRQAVVVPNGVDVGRFRGIDALRGPARRQLGIADDARVFLFSASKWGPNREAFDYLLRFAKGNAALLAQERIHILVAGNVATVPVRLPGFTATGGVDHLEPYFAAADAAINPIVSGAGTNVKMCEFIALRLPILTTPFGARGFRIEDGETGFVFEREALAGSLRRVGRLFDEDRGQLRQIAANAYARNQGLIDVDAGVRALVEAVDLARERLRPVGQAAVLGTGPSMESVSRT